MGLSEIVGEGDKIAVEAEVADGAAVKVAVVVLVGETASGGLTVGVNDCTVLDGAGVGDFTSGVAVSVNTFVAVGFAVSVGFGVGDDSGVEGTVAILTGVVVGSSMPPGVCVGGRVDVAGATVGIKGVFVGAAVGKVGAPGV